MRRERTPKSVPTPRPRSAGKPTPTPHKAARASHGWQRGTSNAPLHTIHLRDGKSTVLGLLLCFCVALGTLWGLAKVRAQHQRLVIGDELAKMTSTYNDLLDRKNRLQAELAHLRHPEHIREQAARRLRMQVALPEHIERVEVELQPDASNAKGDQRNSSPKAERSP